VSSNPSKKIASKCNYRKKRSIANVKKGGVAGDISTYGGFNQFLVNHNSLKELTKNGEKLKIKFSFRVALPL